MRTACPPVGHGSGRHRRAHRAVLSRRRLPHRLVATLRRLSALVSDAAQARVLSVGYHLAPEHPFPAAVHDALTAYRGLLARGIAPRQILNRRQFLRRRTGARPARGTARRREAQVPAAAVAISPWTDMEMTGESRRTRAAADRIVTPDGEKEAADWYLAGQDPRHPYRRRSTPICRDCRRSSSTSATPRSSSTTPPGSPPGRAAPASRSRSRSGTRCLIAGIPSPGSSPKPTRPWAPSAARYRDTLPPVSCHAPFCAQGSRPRTTTATECGVPGAVRPAARSCRDGFAGQCGRYAHPESRLGIGGYLVHSPMLACAQAWYRQRVTSWIQPSPIAAAATVNIAHWAVRTWPIRAVNVGPGRILAGAHGPLAQRPGCA